MANTAIEVPFYVALGGEPLAGAANEMEFENLRTLLGTDKSASAPTISEIGGGWYKFGVAYGTAPFDEGDLVSVIDADKNGANGLLNIERYIPVEVRLDFYGLARLVNSMSQNKTSGDMLLKDNGGNTILKLGITDDESTLDRVPGAAT
jgi:hypothetical protein